MDSNLNMSSTTLKELLKFGCTEAIRNVNRNLYLWKKTENSEKKSMSVDINEVNGLVKNWIMRCLKYKVGEEIIRRIFTKGTFFVHLQPDGNIQDICLNSLDYWEKNEFHSAMKEVIENEINYDALKYDPSDYVSLDDTQFRGFDPTFFLPLDDIRNFKFQL